MTTGVLERRMLRAVWLVLLSGSAAACTHATRQPLVEPLAPKVMVMVAAEWGSSPEEWTGEGREWARGLELSRSIAVAGLDIPVHCTADEVCVMVTGVGPVQAALSMMATGLSPRLDLRRSYFLVNGTAGVDPQAATVGSVVWVRSVIDADLCSEIDPRELPPDFPASRFSVFCEVPWCEPWPSPPGIFTTDDRLRSWAIGLTAGLELADDQATRDLRRRYAAFDAASGAPRVIEGDAIAGATYWHGTIMSRWAHGWVDNWSGGSGRYCVTDSEDFAIMHAADTLSRAGRLDLSRILILRGASDFDQPGEGVTALASLLGGQVSPLAKENLYRVGSVVVSAILDNWDSFRAGPMPVK